MKEKPDNKHILVTLRNRKYGRPLPIMADTLQDH